MKANHLFEKLSSNSDSIDADILELERCLQQNSVIIIVIITVNINY